MVLLLVLRRYAYLVLKSKGLAEERMSSPVSILTSSKVGVMGPCQKKNALKVSDQKQPAAESKGSSFLRSAKDKARHWAIPISS